jgi:hypothetical protein
MLVFNNLWADIVINIKQVSKFADIISEDNYATTDASIIIKPLEVAEVTVVDESTLYLYSHADDIHRTDYISMYSIGEIPKRMLVVEQFYESYRGNNEAMGVAFDPDIVFAVSYIIPNSIINLFVVYNIVCVIIFIIVFAVACVISYKILARWLN